MQYLAIEAFEKSLHFTIECNISMKGPIDSTLDSLDPQKFSSNFKHC